MEKQKARRCINPSFQPVLALDRFHDLFGAIFSGWSQRSRPGGPELLNDGFASFNVRAFQTDNQRNLQTGLLFTAATTPSAMTSQRIDAAKMVPPGIL